MTEYDLKKRGLLLEDEVERAIDDALEDIPLEIVTDELNQSEDLNFLLEEELLPADEREFSYEPEETNIDALTVAEEPVNQSLEEQTPAGLDNAPSFFDRYFGEETDLQPEKDHLDRSPETNTPERFQSEQKEEELEINEAEPEVIEKSYTYKDGDLWSSMTIEGNNIEINLKDFFPDAGEYERFVTAIRNGEEYEATFFTRAEELDTDTTLGYHSITYFIEDGIPCGIYYPVFEEKLDLLKNETTEQEEDYTTTGGDNIKETPLLPIEELPMTEAPTDSQEMRTVIMADEDPTPIMGHKVEEIKDKEEPTTIMPIEVVDAMQEIIASRENNSLSEGELNKINTIQEIEITTNGSEKFLEENPLIIPSEEHEVVSFMAEPIHNDKPFMNEKTEMIDIEDISPIEEIPDKEPSVLLPNKGIQLIKPSAKEPKLVDESDLQGNDETLCLYRKEQTPAQRDALLTIEAIPENQASEFSSLSNETSKPDELTPILPLEETVEPSSPVEDIIIQPKPEGGQGDRATHQEVGEIQELLPIESNWERKQDSQVQIVSHPEVSTEAEVEDEMMGLNIENSQNNIEEVSTSLDQHADSLREDISESITHTSRQGLVRGESPNEHAIEPMLQSATNHGSTTVVENKKPDMMSGHLSEPNPGYKPEAFAIPDLKEEHATVINVIHGESAARSHGREINATKTTTTQNAGVDKVIQSQSRAGIIDDPVLNDFGQEFGFQESLLNEVGSLTLPTLQIETEREPNMTHSKVSPINDNDQTTVTPIIIALDEDEKLILPRRRRLPSMKRRV